MRGRIPMYLSVIRAVKNSFFPPMLGKILVPVKRSIDYAVKIRVRPDKMGVETANVKHSMNPFCEIAMEQGIAMKEVGNASEVIAVTLGPSKSQETLRTALAMGTAPLLREVSYLQGADKAIHVTVEEDTDLQPLAVAKLLQKIVEKEKPTLVITGKQAIDDDSNQTAQLLAGLMGWNQATFASEVKVSSESEINVVREIDGGLETLSVPLPAVISADLRLNKPRFTKLQAIMKARKQPIDSFSPNDLGVDITPRLTTVSVDEPPLRKAGQMVGSVEELVQKLKADGVL